LSTPAQWYISVIFPNPFSTHNAALQARGIAGARNERTLFPVALQAFVRLDVRSRLSEEPPCRTDLFSSEGGSVSERLLKEELGSSVHGRMRDL
jgi:hypothetical protein